METKTISISKIKIGKRHRKDLGELQSLADSIGELGLLENIGVTEKNDLVFGERRIRAVADILNWKSIECKVVKVPSIAAGEYAENMIRKDFTVSERLAIAETIEGEMPERRGRPTDKKVDPGPQLTGRKTRDVVAELAGFSTGKEYERAKKVANNGSVALVTAMDEGDVPITTAAKLAELPKSDQTAAIKSGKEGIKRAIQGVKPKPAYPASDKFLDMMKNFAGLQTEIVKDYGSFKKMLDSKDWDPQETHWAKQFVAGFAIDFAQMKKEFKDA